MDAAVALVQAYLRLNGYFTETEYPIVTLDGKNAVSLTDIDILAVRFPRAGRWIPSKRETVPPDPALAPTTDRMDMIIGEVKEQHGRFNPGVFTLPVIESVLRRFGCCENPRETAEAILQGQRHCSHGGALNHCNIRIVVFSGEQPAKQSARFQSISLLHIARFVAQHMAEHEQMLLHTAQKDEVLSFMNLLLKLGMKI